MKPHPYSENTLIPPGFINSMGYVDESEVNGPGSRAVLWVQGCSRECEDCFNPASWPFEINQWVTIDSIVEKVLNNPRNEGITFSGSEPFWQAPALAQLAQKLKAKGLNVMSFSGFTREQLQGANAPMGSLDLLRQLDILIDGAYIPALAINDPNSPISLRNQRVHILNPAFCDRISWASDQVEIHMLQDGCRIFTGYQGQSQFLARLTTTSGLFCMLTAV